MGLEEAKSLIGKLLRQFGKYYLTKGKWKILIFKFIKKTSYVYIMEFCFFDEFSFLKIDIPSID